MESEISGVFRVKLVTKNYTAWIPRNPMPSCFCSVMCLFEEIYECCKLDCRTLICFLLNSILAGFMSKKSHFVN